MAPRAYRESKLHNGDHVDGAFSSAPGVRCPPNFRRELSGCFRQRRARYR